MGKFQIAISSVLIGCIASSCASLGLKNTVINEKLIMSHCNQQNIYSYSADEMPEPLSYADIDSTLHDRISPNSMHIAHTIGIVNLLEHYAKLRTQPLDTDRLTQRMDILELRQEIDRRINNASLEVSAVSSELDCEEERTSQVANFLKGKESDLESKLTMGAIVIGASGAIDSHGRHHQKRTPKQ